ncbi:alpha,alpha-trehalase [Francisella sp. Scap27]|uniref:trehalase family glycosidase n=1 Tax=Francisella sp. Scap27 TaxID=2589986 RepID=UPI0015B8BF79|nr:trehalase family glycosidase [Francisella sp. Scap27]QLE79154.1 alpha,alpha-trehalase [Francisella sp. Scap27]
MKIKNNLIQLSGELFEAVQLEPCFNDSKYFVDMTPKKNPQEILENYEKLKGNNNFNLKAFIEENFYPPVAEKTFNQNEKLSLEDYIKQMWSFLSLSSDKDDELSSLIPLPKPYIIPGGRFREVYYWDCYFTCEGLRVDGQIKLIENIADNFAFLINKIGFIPNANRKYYLTRSQPPLFYLIVEILYKELGILAISKYLEPLEKEYNFWMNTKRNIDGLNRYWDELDTPRPESFREDIEHAQTIANKQDFYRNIRAACESGWDFSSRWFTDTDNFNTIQTTDILPIDLNCYLYGLENSLSTWFKEISNNSKADKYSKLALLRKEIIQTKFWNQEKNFFYDVNKKTSAQTNIISLAGVTPLFLNIATAEQAKGVAQIIERDFLTEHGLITTLNKTSQQWDSPNGWAPLQWQTIIGLQNYGYNELAKKIASYFVETVNKKYCETGKIREKYDVCNLEVKASGGEYIVQDGFGWTNGVVSALINMLR